MSYKQRRSMFTIWLSPKWFVFVKRYLTVHIQGRRRGIAAIHSDRINFELVGAPEISMIFSPRLLVHLSTICVFHITSESCTCLQGFKINNWKKSLIDKDICRTPLIFVKKTFLYLCAGYGGRF